MSKSKYRFITEIVNSQTSSFVPDVAFHPDGRFFAVSYRDNNQVRVYEAASCRLLRTYENPEAELSFPHGVAITRNHLIVSNKLAACSTEPSRFTVYRIDDPSGAPVDVFTTPLARLREAHSMVVRDGLLYVTYCGKDIGAILTYAFDDRSGRITGPISILEDWFARYGEPKGVCLNEDGTRIFVTMAVEKRLDDSRRGLAAQNRLRKVYGWEGVLSWLLQRGHAIRHHFNGVAVFAVDRSGNLSKQPVQLFKQAESRLENIHIVDGGCVVADPLNDCVYYYDLKDDSRFESPAQVLVESLSFPHDACLSPDKKRLVVTNYGIEVSRGIPQWERFRQPRGDKITVYERVG